MSVFGRIYGTYRATLNQIQATWGNASGYAAAKWDRFTKAKSWNITTAENVIPSDQYERLNSDAWRFYRDNPYFRKIVRNIVSKSVGTGLTPCSGAVKRTPEGDVPATEFRKRAQQLWTEQSAAIDFTGIPSRGGETAAGLERMALLQCVLDGEVLYSLRDIDGPEQRRRRLPSPVTVQLIDSARLADDFINGLVADGHYFYRGLEFNASMQRYGYWLHDVVPGVHNEISISTEPKFYPVEIINHVYVKDDVDQLRGASWFAPAIPTGRDVSDLQYNFLKSTAVASCVVGGYRPGTGKTTFGQKGSSSDDAVDANGNVINRMSPGLLLNLGKDGDFKGFSPNMNLAGYEAFGQYILRGIAAAMPGTKASTVTGDYRASSFSSERAADNDTWPEIEVIQSWFATNYCQPIYEKVVTAAVVDGYFDGVVTAAEFNAHRARYLRCKWQGPVARSIKPSEDVKAAADRIRAGISDPQTEAARLGMPLEDVLHRVKAFIDQAEQIGLPEIYVNNVLGFDTKDVLSIEEPERETANGGANVAED